MDNFNFKKFLAEGKLHEAMSAQDTEDIAGMVADEFTKESADKGEYLRYSVGRVEGDFFELDTEATDMSSEDLDMRGVGEGWGGNFSVEATEDGHEVRNAEKGGLVAMIDAMGNFRMLSADESRAEMGLEEKVGKFTSSDKDEYIGDDGEKEDEEYLKYLKSGGKVGLPGMGIQTKHLTGEDEMLDEGQEAKDEVEEVKSTKIKKSELKEMIKAAMLAEAEKDEDVEDVEVEDDVDVDADVDVDVDMDMDAGEGGINVKQDADADLGGTIGDVQDNLEAALEAARKLGDEKLEDQIGNTLTFFTRQHVVKEGDMLKDEAELELEEAMSDDEIKDMARKQAFGKGLPGDLIEPAIDIIVGMIRGIEALGIDPQKELDDQDVSPEQLGKLMPLVKDMQEKLFALVDNYTDSQPKEKSHFEKRLDKMRAQQNESVVFPMWNKIK